MNSTTSSLASSNRSSTLYNHKEQKDKIGVSNLKIFDGEDLTHGDRKKLQSLQQKDWIDQQTGEKEEKLRAEKESKQAFDTQTLQLNGMRSALEQDHEQKRKAMAKAYQEANLQLSKEKQDREKDQRLIEQNAKKAHIEYNTSHDFYTENPETCKSYVSETRVLKYHWKGMNADQKNEILAEQDKQIKQTEMLKKERQEEERMFAIQTEHQRIMQVQMEREKNRRQAEILRNQKEFNLLKNQEQQIKIKTMYDVRVEDPKMQI